MQVRFTPVACYARLNVDKLETTEYVSQRAGKGERSAPKLTALYLSLYDSKLQPFTSHVDFSNTLSFECHCSQPLSSLPRHADSTTTARCPLASAPTPTATPCHQQPSQRSGSIQKIKNKVGSINDLNCCPSPLPPPHSISVTKNQEAPSTAKHMSSSASTTFNAAPSAPLVKDKKKLSRKASASQQAAAAAVQKPATATVTAVAKKASTPEMGAGAPTPSSSSAASPGEPEQHVDGDVVDSAMRKLKGTRPDLLRTSTYYEGAKVWRRCDRRVRRSVGRLTGMDAMGVFRLIGLGWSFVSDTVGGAYGVGVLARGDRRFAALRALIFLIDQPGHMTEEYLGCKSCGVSTLQPCADSSLLPVGRTQDQAEITYNN